MWPKVTCPVEAGRVQDGHLTAESQVPPEASLSVLVSRVSFGLQGLRKTHGDGHHSVVPPR